MNKELLFKLGLLLVVKFEQILKKSPKKLWILEYQQNIKRQENKYLKTT
tara:strand:- start:9430 stop:9576 length:147 start_codon:yes stop_codon:yes gene_type:complete